MFFLYPLVLLLLVIPALYFLYSFKRSVHDFKKHFSTSILNKLSIESSYLSRTLKYKIFLLILALFIIALARPVTKLSSAHYSLSKASVIIAIDVSKSMSNTDVYPTRLALAKEKLKQLVIQAENLNVGILFYAQNAYVLYPLSKNPTLLSSLLQDINLTQQFSPNSNLFAALEGSEYLLKKQNNKHIILLSDGGEDVSRKNELAYLKSKNIALSTLAINNRINHALVNLSSQSNGKYIPYTLGSNDIHALLDVIPKSKAASKDDHDDITLYNEYFTYPLLTAILLLLVMFIPLKRPKNTSLLILFSVWSVSTMQTSLHAGLFDFWYLNKAKSLYEEKSYVSSIAAYTKADLTPEGYYNLATAFYKSEQYNNALITYKKALGTNKKINAKIYYNMATTYAKKNKLDLAKVYYQKSLQTHHYKIALENLNLITLQLKVQRKNLHKEYEKLRFKAITKTDYAPNNADSNYVIKVHTYIPSKEDLWFQKMLKQKSPLYLQKLNTLRKSGDADNPW